MGDGCDYSPTGKHVANYIRCIHCGQPIILVESNARMKWGCRIVILVNLALWTFTLWKVASCFY